MKRFLVASACALASLSVAHAADIETQYSEHDWSGPYIGLQAGYGWGESDASIERSDQSAAAASEPISIFFGGGSIDAEGFLGGGHAGYNLQSGSLVLGIEGDAEFSDTNGDTDVIGETTFAKQAKEFDWLASLRLRAGYAVDRVLFYATAGVAFAQVDMSFKLTDEEFIEALGPFHESENETAFGVTLGGGVEFALAENLTLRAEYRYTDLEDTSFTGINFNAVTYGFENDFHTVRGGMSWYF